MSTSQRFGLPNLKRTHIAKQCVCCGSEQLNKSPAILMPFVAHRALGWQPVEIDDSWGLNTINNGHAYSICNSLSCAECGFLFLDIRFSEEELSALYNGYREEAYTNLRNFYEPGYQSRNEALNEGENYISKVESFLSPYLTLPISMLDWGGDTGKNSPFKNNHSQFHIYDISNKPVIEGAKHVNKETAYQTEYDLIVCSNVLEHVPYPSDVIMEMTAAMRQNTILYIEVPHEEIVRTASMNEDLHLKKKHWHEHINFFNDQSLQKLVELCGLTIISKQQLYEYSHGHPVSHIQIACQLAQTS
jgi:hypothetical protein